MTALTLLTATSCWIAACPPVAVPCESAETICTWCPPARPPLALTHLAHACAVGRIARVLEASGPLRETIKPTLMVEPVALDPVLVLALLLLLDDELELQPTAAKTVTAVIPARSTIREYRATGHSPSWGVGLPS